MDTFTFMISLVLMMLAIQFNENWLVFAIIALTILTSRSITMAILLLIVGAVLYFTQGMLESYWPIVFFGLIILAVLLGLGRQQQPEYYNPDMYSGLMGGGEGY